MSRVVFTKRIKLVVGVLTFLFLALFIGLYIGTIAPKAKQLKLIEQDKAEVATQIQETTRKKNQLQKSKGLLQSTEIKGIPTKSEIVTYLKDIEATLKQNGGKVSQIDLDEQDEYTSKSDASTKLRRGTFSVQLSAGTKEQLYKTVGSFDTRPRFVNFNSFSYEGRSKYEPPSAEDVLKGQVYRMNINYDVYYLAMPTKKAK